MNLKEVMQALIDGKVLICHKEFYKISNDRICRWISDKWVDENWVDDNLHIIGFDIHFFVRVGAKISDTDPESEYKKSLEPKYGSLGFDRAKLDISIYSEYCEYCHCECPCDCEDKTIDKREKFHGALRTLIELKAHPLSVVIVRDRRQYFIDIKNGDFHCFSYRGIEDKLSIVSPFFNSEKDAMKAFKDIGENKILSMFKVLQGIYDE